MRQTPLAGPVVPEVNTISAASPPSTATGQNPEVAWRWMSSSVLLMEPFELEPTPRKITCGDGV